MLDFKCIDMFEILQKQYVSIIFLRIYGAAEVHVNVVKDSIKMHIEGKAFMATLNESNLIKIYDIKVTVINHDIW
jgi:hypothetical protein